MFSSGAHVNGQADIRHPPVPVALPEALIMDPVTHVGFTDAVRRELQAQMRKSVSLFSGGGIVILRLRFGQSAPSSHSLPWCLAFPAFGQGAVTSCGPLPFTPMFTTAQDLDGTWIPVSSNIMEHLSSVLLVGMDLTAAAKLTATSKRQILRCVSSCELGIATPAGGGAGGGGGGREAAEAAGV